MDFRKSFSKPFKKLKDKFPGSSHKQDGRSGSEDSRKGGGADIEGGGTGQQNPYLNSEFDVGGTTSGPSQEGSNTGGKKAALVNIDPPVSAPSISRIRELDST